MEGKCAPPWVIESETLAPTACHHPTAPHETCSTIPSPHGDAHRPLPRPPQHEHPGSRSWSKSSSGLSPDVQGSLHQHPGPGDCLAPGRSCLPSAPTPDPQLRHPVIHTQPCSPPQVRPAHGSGAPTGLPSPGGTPCPAHGKTDCRAGLALQGEAVGKIPKGQRRPRCSQGPSRDSAPSLLTQHCRSHVRGSLSFTGYSL